MAKRKETRRENFTKASLEKLHAPEGTRFFVRDKRQDNLSVLVGPRGVVYYLVGRVHGRPERIKLGTFPAMSVDTARRACKKRLGEIASGKNPAEERRADRALGTVADLCEFYVQTHSLPHKKRPDDDISRIRLHLSRWGSRKLRTIRAENIKGLHNTLASEFGKVTSNRALAVLRAAYNHAIRCGKWDGANPAARFQAFREHPRQRHLGPTEFARWYEALQAEPDGVFKDFFLLLAFTGQRRRNLQSMRWDDIDFERSVWTIDAYHSKSAKAIDVPLTPAALEVIERRRKLSTGEPWVLPSRGRTGHITEPKKVWRRLIDRAGLEDVTLHTMRHTFASWLYDSGADDRLVAAALGHADLQSTRRYIHLHSTDIVHDAAATATVAMLKAANGKATTKRASRKGATNAK